ncbi:MAG: TolB family protein [Pseudobdellovibrionaceae bacterium]
MSRQSFNILQRWSALVVTVCLLPVLFLFQNCARAVFITQSTEDLFKNNGAGYGGKPNGEYYRYSPEFTCEGKEMFLTHISVSEAGILLTENKKLACGAIQKNIDPSLMDTSIYQNEIIGYQEGIFEGSNELPTGIPANLVEVWCRDTRDQTGIETVTHFDRTTSLAVNRIYHAISNPDGSKSHQLIPDFPVSRVVSPTTVTVKDGNGFELIVHRDQPAAQLGVFVGELNALINGQPVRRETYCRFGGSLDSTIWPAKQIVDLNVLYFKKSPDLNYFSFSSDTGLAGSQASLYSSTADGSRQTRVSQSLTTSNYNFSFSADSKKLLYMNDGLGPVTTSLGIFHLDGTANIEATSDTSQASNYQITGDARYLVYNSAQIGNSWLRSMPLNGGPAVDIGASLSRQPVGETRVDSIQRIGSDRFEVSAVGSRVAFICCDSRLELYSVHADGSGLLKITPPMSAGFGLYGVRFAISTSDQVLMAFAWKGGVTSPMLYETFAVQADGSGSVMIPDGWQWSQTSPSGEFGLILRRSTVTEYQLIHLKTGARLPLPAFPGSGSFIGSVQAIQDFESFFFTQDSTAYVGHLIDTTSGKSRLLSVSTGNGTVSEICPGISSSNIREVRPNTFVLVSGDSTSGMIHVYLDSPSQSCRLVNSIPTSLTSTSVLSFKPSPDNQNLLVKKQTKNTDGTIAEDQLFLIPLNGKQPYLINTPVFKAATILSFDFLNDSKSVIYMGDQIRPGEKNIFSWKAP